METSAYKLFAENLLIEGDFQAKSTKSGKTVDYKSKEARDDAIKAGDAVELDKDKQDKDTEEPTGKLGGGDYERDFDDSEPEDKPFGGDTGDEGGGDVQSGIDDFKAYLDSELEPRYAQLRHRDLDNFQDFVKSKGLEITSIKQLDAHDGGTAMGITLSNGTEVEFTRGGKFSIDGKSTGIAKHLDLGEPKGGEEKGGEPEGEEPSDEPKGADNPLSSDYDSKKAGVDFKKDAEYMIGRDRGGGKRAISSYTSDLNFGPGSRRRAIKRREEWDKKKELRGQRATAIASGEVAPNSPEDANMALDHSQQEIYRAKRSRDGKISFKTLKKAKSQQKAIKKAIKQQAKKQGWKTSFGTGRVKTENANSVIINGKKYRAIKESVEPTITDPSEIGALHKRMKVNWDNK